MNEFWAIKRLAVICATLFAAVSYVAYVRLGFAGQIPDLNPLGAPVEDILDFPERLGFEGREIFNGTYRVLDFGFLTSLTLLLTLIACALRPKRFWWVVLAFAAIFCAADLTENQLLAGIVNGNAPEKAAQHANYVNLCTRVKFAALLLALAAMLTSWRQKEPMS